MHGPKIQLRDPRRKLFHQACFTIRVVAHTCRSSGAGGTFLGNFSRHLRDEAGGGLGSARNLKRVGSAVGAGRHGLLTDHDGAARAIATARCRLVISNLRPLTPKTLMS